MKNVNKKFEKISPLSPGNTRFGSSYFQLGSSNSTIAVDTKLAWIPEEINQWTPKLWFFFFSRDVSATIMDTITDTFNEL